MMEYIRIAEKEDEDAIELPCEDDGTLLLSTVNGQFPGACGLKYRNEDTGTTRGVKLTEGKFYSPAGCTWDNATYICVFPKVDNKRKADDAFENSATKARRRVENKKCVDLIILGLPYQLTEEELKEYFTSTFGEIVACQIKMDTVKKRSKGFGFVKFMKYECQLRALAANHVLQGRSCQVKYPAPKQQSDYESNRKIFVGHVSEEMTEEDLNDYFGEFGEVTSALIPHPFRGFAFVTFLDPDVALSLFDEEHNLKGARLRIGSAIPKHEKGQKPFDSDNRNRFDNSWNNRNDSDNSRPWAGNHPGGGGGGRDWNRYNSNNGGGHMHSSPAGGGNYGPNSNSSPKGMGNSSNVNIPLTPAIVAAALNQAGWGMLNNYQGGSQGPHHDQGQSGYWSSHSSGGSGGWMKGDRGSD